MLQKPITFSQKIFMAPILNNCGRLQRISSLYGRQTACRKVKEKGAISDTEVTYGLQNQNLPTKGGFKECLPAT
jgi:hypothetical protein